jgi:hypothetical protein
MDGFKSTDEVIQQAYTLAYFILRDEEAATFVVREALGKLEVAAAAQVKRLYYTPTRRALWHRSKPTGIRTKVSLSDLHLLQRLVYVESEPFERARERKCDALGDADLLVHFVKHLVRISIKRNSFYVALGVSRLLHDYTTGETMEIYNVVVQDPDRVKDDYYYRSRKGRLLQEIRERFEDLVSVCRAQRGEERFQTSESPGDFVGLVGECLRQFSPWQTPCPVPRRYDPVSDEIPTLSSAHQGDEDKAEINRIHAVVHPDCYELLTSSLRLEPPAQRLRVPRFNLPNGKNDMSGPNDKARTPAPLLDSEELAALKRILGEQSARRKATHAGLLSVAVDNVERARLDLELAGSVIVALEDGDELVEVRALDGEGGRTLLASHLLSGEPGANAAESQIVLEGGQKLTFKISHAPAGANEAVETNTAVKTNEAARAFLSVSYGETEWLSAASLLRRRLMRRIYAPDGSVGRRNVSLAVPAFAALLLLVCAGSLAFYLFRNTRGPSVARVATNVQVSVNSQQPAASQAQNDAAKDNANAATSDGPSAVGDEHSEGGDKTSETIAGSQPAPRNTHEDAAAQNSSPGETAQAAIPTGAATLPRTQRPDAGASRPAAGQPQVASNPVGSATESGRSALTSERDSDATRSFGQGGGATALSKVRKVFIEVAGGGDLGAQTARLLADGLREGQRLTPTDAKDDADAAFKIKVSAKPHSGAARSDKALGDSAQEKRTVTLYVRLVNEDGEVIWPSSGRGGAATYTGTLKDVTDRIAADLLKAVLKSDAQK